VTLPSKGGDTQFVNVHASYEDFVFDLPCNALSA
jgi:hypothetical protein